MHTLVKCIHYFAKTLKCQNFLIQSNDVYLCYFASRKQSNKAKSMIYPDKENGCHTLPKL